MSKRTTSSSSKTKAEGLALTERQKIISLASAVKLPYEPSSFTVDQLREAIAAARK